MVGKYLYCEFHREEEIKHLLWEYLAVFESSAPVNSYLDESVGEGRSLSPVPSSLLKVVAIHSEMLSHFRTSIYRNYTT